MSTTELLHELMKDYPKQPKTPQKAFYSLQHQEAWRGRDRLIQQGQKEMPC